MSKDLIFTSPNMGDYNKIIFKTGMHGLQQKYILPPAITKETLELGSKYCHEMTCHAVRFAVGDLIRAVNAGANAVMFSAGLDACRFRYNWAEHKKILEEVFNREIYFFVIRHNDVPGSIRAFIKDMGLDIPENKAREILLRINLKIDLYDALTMLYQKHKLNNPCLAKEIRECFGSAIFDTENNKELAKIFKQMKKEFEQIKDIQMFDSKLNILLIGSNYDIFEPYASNGLDDLLTSLGVSCTLMLNYHSLSPFRFFDNEAAQYCRSQRPVTELIMDKIKTSLVSEEAVMRNNGFGGYGLFNLACAADAPEQGYDGIIHIYPFFCMPEIILKPLIKQKCGAAGMPVLSIVADDNNSDIGFKTRVEAFVDLMRWKK